MSKPKILLVGKNGQVGFELAKTLQLIGDVVALDRSELDLTSSEEIKRVVRHIHPAFIVNAAAYTAVDHAESDAAAARAINAIAPAIMAEEARKIGACLVHYSTDYIFDGAKSSPYDENDSPRPLNVYGQTKLEGENGIRAAGGSYLIFRTSWVYATRGKNFLLTILRLATQRDELRIVQDQHGSPTTSGEIAKATSQILQRICAKENGMEISGVNGVYHMTASGVTTWCDFARAILKCASGAQAVPWLLSATNRLPLKTQIVRPIPSSDYPTPARRPAYSVLSNKRLHGTFGVTLSDWQRQLVSLFEIEPGPGMKTTTI